MSELAALKQKLEERFVYLNGGIREQGERRLWTEVSYDLFFEVLDFAVRELGFNALCTITGLDEGEYLAFIYHLSQGGIVLNLKTRVVKDKENLRTVTGYFPGAAIYEREVTDLLGVKVEGLPSGVRYPLPDDWPTGQYPLRKDWDPKVLDQKGSA
ncbi:MAG: NADH-quinone oxidoreductase subunit C [Candidatus Margulisbacteria bacterium]|jgi:Ni,Fe-hydrogenase III component G|nr:NADH-quinone oxidoreductase subunit C [Candidatus Margulisiibacteriota bacterium]